MIHKNYHFIFYFDFQKEAHTPQVYPFIYYFFLFHFILSMHNSFVFHSVTSIYDVLIGLVLDYNQEYLRMAARKESEVDIS